MAPLTRVVILGLDSAPPDLVFRRLRGSLPNLERLMAAGGYGRLRSCDPPITVPAWMVMATGKSPGSLGLYGFRHRRGFAYREVTTPTSASVRERTLWDRLGEAGYDSILVGVPPSYPPRPLRGHSVGCFLTPDAAADYTYPPELKREIEALVGDYLFDITFRTDDRDTVLEQLYAMTDQHFRVFEHLLRTKPWDLAMMVEIGIDRAQHAFWKFFDTDHPKHEPGNRYESVVPDYYRFVDERIGRILDAVGDGATIFVVSDHGAKGMRGAFCVNEWLIREGYLALKTRPQEPAPLDRVDVDWSRTKAWGWGGYYARIFINLEGREPSGVVAAAQYEALRDELSDKLARVTDPEGRTMDTRVYRPEQIYAEVRGDAPDLMVYFDDLWWRSAGTVGHGALYLSENDTGPDDAVHDYDGIFVMSTPPEGAAPGSELSGLRLIDMAPTVLDRMGVAIDEPLEGRPIR